jgi:PhnB protein
VTPNILPRHRVKRSVPVGAESVRHGSDLDTDTAVVWTAACARWHATKPTGTATRRYPSLTRIAGCGTRADGSFVSATPDDISPSASRQGTLAVVIAIQPELWVDRGAQAVQFYVAAFGATVLHQVGDGEDIVAQLAVGPAAFWVAAAGDSAERRVPKALGAATGRLLLVADNPDEIWRRAVAAGADPKSDVTIEHGAGELAGSWIRSATSGRSASHSSTGPLPTAADTTPDDRPDHQPQSATAAQIPVAMRSSRNRFRRSRAA